MKLKICLNEFINNHFIIFVFVIGCNVFLLGFWYEKSLASHYNPAILTLLVYTAWIGGIILITMAVWEQAKLSTEIYKLRSSYGR